MPYDVINSSRQSFVVDSINVMEAEGWRPIGGLSAVKSSDGAVLYMQSIYKEPEKAKVKPKPAANVFKPPTFGEVRDYILEKKSKVDPIAFFNHYEANGWMRGKAKIKKWKSCVATWEQGVKEAAQQPNRYGPTKGSVDSSTPRKPEPECVTAGCKNERMPPFKVCDICDGRGLG